MKFIIVYSPEAIKDKEKILKSGNQSLFKKT